MASKFKDFGSLWIWFSGYHRVLAQKVRVDKIMKIQFSDKRFIFDILCNCSLRFSSSILHFRIIFISLFAFASAARDICLVLSDRLLANFLLILFFPDFMRQLKRNFNFCFTLFQISHFLAHKKVNRERFLSIFLRENSK